MHGLTQTHGAGHARRVLAITELTGEHREIGELRRKDGARFWADVTIATRVSTKRSLIIGSG